MTTLSQHENALEAEFAHQQELRFQAREKAVKNLAIWAAGRLGKTGDALEAFAQEIVAADVPNPTPDATIERIAKALEPRGIGKPEIHQMMDRLIAAADAAVHSPLPPPR